MENMQGSEASCLTLQEISNMHTLYPFVIAFSSQRIHANHLLGIIVLDASEIAKFPIHRLLRSQQIGNLHIKSVTPHALPRNPLHHSGVVPRSLGILD